ncbi:unnamed protein product [Brachionus calyciflorus]|uniref:Uncharacterized protein n=1 Tax=Brachionus calyciflorus TaxID=104777 RepID=A0A813PYC7_9BILA|nr:unnamed protein product [Brachionus calyciflorus]
MWLIHRFITELKCPNNQLPINSECRSPISDDQLCSPLSDFCQNLDSKCIKKDVSSNFVCGKCKENQFININSICVDKIKDDQICQNILDKCVNPKFSCQENADGDLRCRNVKIGGICSSILDQCVDPLHVCLKKKATDKNRYCLKCDILTHFTDVDLTCKKKIANGKVCKSPFNQCQTLGYSCLRK